MNDSNKLSYDELFQINDELRHIIADLKKDNKELTLTINELRTYQQNMEKFTHRVYAPDKSYKDFEKKVDKLTEENLSLAKTIECLENKLEESNTAKEKEIDYLWDEIIGPLQKKEQEQKDLENKIETLEQEKKEIDLLQEKIQDQEAKLNNAFKADLNNFQQIKDLEKVIDTQNIVINLAAGYISASERFSNTHPMDVKRWLMGGMQ